MSLPTEIQTECPILVYVSGEGVLGMEMTSKCTIADLKGKVRTRTGIPVSKQIIMFEDQELIDERVFSQDDLLESMNGRNMVTVVQHVCFFCHFFFLLA